jgi:hypothetical protein
MTRRVCVAIAMVIACAWPLHLPLNNPNEGVRVFAARSLAVHHSWAIDAVIKEWGFIDDKARCPVVAVGARCSSKAPYPTLLAAASSVWLPRDVARDTFTWWARWWGAIVPSCLLWWGALRALRRTLNMDDDTTAIVAVAAVMGSGVLAGMTVMSGHASSAAAVVWLMALAMDLRSTVRDAAIAGAMAALALGFEYTAALVVVPLVIAWLWHHRSWRFVIAAVIAGMAVATPMMVAHHQQFGAPWRTGYSSLDNPAYAQLVNPAGFQFSAAAVIESLMSPSVGLLWFSPWLLCALWGWRHTPRIERIVAMVGTLSMLSFAAMFPGWRGGWSVGWRYGLPLVALWLMACARGMSIRSGWQRVVVVMLVGIAVLHAGLAGAFFPHLSDVMSAPVHRFLLPMIARGLSVHGLLFAVGVPSPWAAWALAILVLSPWLLLLKQKREH